MEDIGWLGCSISLTKFVPPSVNDSTAVSGNASTQTRTIWSFYEIDYAHNLEIKFEFAKKWTPEGYGQPTGRGDEVDVVAEATVDPVGLEVPSEHVIAQSTPRLLRRLATRQHYAALLTGRHQRRPGSHFDSRIASSSSTIPSVGGTSPPATA